MARLFGIIVVTLTVTASLAAGALEDPQQVQQQDQQHELPWLQQRNLQDNALCSELKVEAFKDAIIADASPDPCKCGSTDLKCQIKNACISNSQGDPFIGDFDVTMIKTGEGETYTQLVEGDFCFTYPQNDPKYPGAKACMKKTTDGIGGPPLCSASVNGNACDACKFCARTGLFLTFNCSNTGFEDRYDCVPGNSKDTVFQFTDNAELVTCPADLVAAVASGGVGTLVPTASGGVGAWITMLSVVVTGVLSLLI
jgi:hypothetical protein